MPCNGLHSEIPSICSSNPDQYKVVIEDNFFSTNTKMLVLAILDKAIYVLRAYEYIKLSKLLT